MSKEQSQEPQTEEAPSHVLPLKGEPWQASDISGPSEKQGTGSPSVTGADLLK